jgi:hypothetical protein
MLIKYYNHALKISFIKKSKLEVEYKYVILTFLIKYVIIKIQFEKTVLYLALT